MERCEECGAPRDILIIMENSNDASYPKHAKCLCENCRDIYAAKGWKNIGAVGKSELVNEKALKRN